MLLKIGSACLQILSNQIIIYYVNISSNSLNMTLKIIHTCSQLKFLNKHLYNMPCIVQARLCDLLSPRCPQLGNCCEEARVGRRTRRTCTWCARPWTRISGSLGYQYSPLSQGWCWTVLSPPFWATWPAPLWTLLPHIPSCFFLFCNSGWRRYQSH